MSAALFGHAQVVLFDLDGTLIDSAPDLGAAVDKMRVDRGLDSYPLERYRAMAGAGARGMLGEAFGITPKDPQFEAMREEFFRNYEACLTQRTQAFNGVQELLQSLEAAGLKWGIVTNKSMRFTDPLVAEMPLLASAAAVVSGDTTPHAKPHPAPLFEAASRMGVQPESCIYVGDDERDIQAGKAAGMGTVAAVYGYLGKTVAVTDWNAEAVINSPLELLQLLGKV
jgi:2-phosphoglycolate phosphatase